MQPTTIILHKKLLLGGKKSNSNFQLDVSLLCDKLDIFLILQCYNYDANEALASSFEKKIRNHLDRRKISHSRLVMVVYHCVVTINKYKEKELYLHWEIRMLLVVQQHIPNALMKHRKQWLQSSHSGEVHDMFLTEGILQTLYYKTIGHKVCTQNFNKVFLDLKEKQKLVEVAFFIDA